MFESVFAALTCFLKAKSAYLVGGFFGGIVRAIISKTGTRWEKLLSGFVGAILAAFLTPVVVSLIGAIVIIPASSLSFAVGLVGMSFCEGVIAICRDWQKNPGRFKRDVRDLILRILAAKKDES
jgi:fructose-specific phosphotransferase system IIC component